LLVGDIVSLKAGDAIQADSIMISGYEAKCDESQVTGEC